MKNYICNTNKYAYDKGYIYLPIEINELPKKINIDGDSLSLKSSFHVSLLCTKDILSKHQKENLEQVILDNFCKFVLENDISFVKFNGEFRLAKFEGRKTIIARCEVSNLEKFSQQLSNQLRIDIPTQPAHVTLYTLQPNIGIGMNSFTELETKSVSVDVPDEIKTALS
jgi:hypothetical protein